uniref:Coiled-coil domain containing 152 n=1 Tax=Sphenodon punctatus TaxID=8508 RepID=A0A8D0HP41_SPHPU
MSQTSEASMKKISVVNLDKLLDDFSKIEKVSVGNKSNRVCFFKFCVFDFYVDLFNKQACTAFNFSVKMNALEKYIFVLLLVEVKEEEHRALIEKKELEILELNRQRRTQDKEKQNEIIKLQTEFNAKLAKIQSKTTKSYPPDPTALPQNIYRRKLQHLQEEKNKEIEILRNTIRDLEQQFGRGGQDSHLKWRRF